MPEKKDSTKRWLIFTAEEGGMDVSETGSSAELAELDADETERMVAEAWATHSVAGDTFDFANGVAVDVTGGSAA